ARGGLDAVVLLEKQHAEAVEPGVLEREPVLRLVHPEPARSAGSGSEEDIVVEDLLARNSFFLQALQILDEVADSEVGRIALPVIAVLLAELKRGDIGRRNHLAFVIVPLKNSLDQLFVFPGEPAEEDSELVPLVRHKRALIRPLEVPGGLKAGFAAQSSAPSGKD